MLIVLSPAKTLDFSPAESPEPTQPRLLEQTSTLIGTLRKKDPRALQKLMSISSALADENALRFQRFDTAESLASAKPALLALAGDVYRGLEASTFSQEELALSQNRIRILSGLYGLLRPLDLIQPYRLEMGTPLKLARKNGLYEFWGNRLTELLRLDIQNTGAKVLINAASKEYMRAIEVEKLSVPVVEADFRENRNGELKFITYNAKMARGKLAQLIVKEGITKLDELRDLDVNGYQYKAELSEPGVLKFVKG